MKPCLLLLLAMPNVAIAAPAPGDATQEALETCLAASSAASTAGQTECEVVARQGYDRRMNAAYTTLMNKLAPAAAARLRTAQRAWLTFRSADEAARSALYETRQGTMYVPMQAAASAGIVRDRAVQLEDLLRVMTIDE